MLILLATEVLILMDGRRVRYVRGILKVKQWLT